MSQLHSSFWLDTADTDVIRERTNDPIALAKYQRVISNFVNILAGKSIPVEYRTHGESYTDSKKVVIGSNITDKTFDSVVGLALHEASHILLSDFPIIYQLASSVKNERVKEFMMQDQTHYTRVKNLMNYIEDRRIDYFIYSNSPGYTGYYKAMYDRYFHNSDITAVLKSDEYREPTFKSYEFRIINFTNSATDLNALPQLKEMYNRIFDYVKTMDSTQSTLDAAVDIYDMILNNISNDTTGGDENQSQQSTKSSDSSGKSNKSVSDKQLERAKKRFEKQKDFLNGESQKGTVKKSEKNQINALAGKDSEIKEATYEKYGYEQKQDVIVLHGITELNKSLMAEAYTKYNTEYRHEIVKSGAIAQMGSMTNIDVQISIRYVSRLDKTEIPVTWIVYDSRKESMSKIKKEFKHLTVAGITPEGLCFESIINELPKGTDMLKTYFLNYSDGMPNFGFYHSNDAVNHTSKMVKKMKSMGYNILSFFISDYSSQTEFNRMYGKNATTVNPTQLVPLASSLQKMFINKNN